MEEEKRKSQREIYADGDTVGPLAFGLLGFFLVWIGVSFSVGFPCGLVVSFLFYLTLSLQTVYGLHSFKWICSPPL